MINDLYLIYQRTFKIKKISPAKNEDKNNRAGKNHSMLNGSTISPSCPASNQSRLVF